MAAIEILSPGLASSIQGRPFRGSRDCGMPLSGAADPLSLALANWLAGNTPETAAIETAFAPFAIKALRAITVSVSGAAQKVQVNGKWQPCRRSINLDRGDILSIPPQNTGCRSYLAVNGGFTAQGFLDGNSTYTPARLGGSSKIPISAGCEITTALEQPQSDIERQLPANMHPVFGEQFLLRFVAGPEFDWLNGYGQNALTSQLWEIGRRSDRMGLQLEGPGLTLSIPNSMSSSAVFPGTIQCPPSGRPFLLSADAQTTGGYPRIAQICRADRHMIGQLRPGAKLSLKRINAAEAGSLYCNKMRILRELMPEIRLD